jgi:hypothetical protein
VDQSVKKELKGYQQQGAGIRSQIEDLDQNKPMLFGKKDWDEKREKLVNEYQGIKSLHDHSKAEKRTQLLYDQRFGREASIKQIEKNHPDLAENFKKAQELLKALAQLREHQQRQEKAQQKEKSKESDWEIDY